jgi:hypothetical protein
MGTRSTIALEFADASVSQVYCHWDGYLDHNGKLLQECYSDPFKLRDLLDLGDFSSLRETVEETAETCYTQTHNEEKNVRRYMNVDEYFAECQQEEYDYLLTERTGWLVRCYSTDGKWVTLEEAKGLIEQMNTEGVY